MVVTCGESTICDRPGRLCNQDMRLSRHYLSHNISLKSSQTVLNMKVHGSPLDRSVPHSDWAVFIKSRNTAQKKQNCFCEPFHVGGVNSTETLEYFLLTNLFL